eukprot:m.230246 g.230246  ORF g.230246 m.230246 type:complete len:250 (-) comp18858_c1_seq2:83-832(-)
MGDADLLLDPKIRLLVVVPIVVITFLVGMARHFLTVLLKTQKPVELVQVMESHALMRSRMLRTNGRFVPPKAFGMRRHFFNDEERGVFIAKKRDVPPPNPMSDPSQMTEMMKGNVMHMVTYMVIGGIINWVFSGFITIRVPFPLTIQFKPMLQRGIELAALDASWVSSASFYFICVFGLRSIFSLVLGEGSDVGDPQFMRAQMAAGNPQQNPGAAFKAEWEALQVAHYEWKLSSVEDQLLRSGLTTESK